MTTHTIFVYGTLLQDQPNHNYYLCNNPCQAKATLSGYTMYNIGSYPGIVPGQDTIPGELYTVDDETLQRLDYLEGEGDLYIRKTAQVTKADGETVSAWIYVYNYSVEGLEKIKVWR